MVRSALLAYSIAEHHDSPFAVPTIDVDDEEILQHDDLLDPDIPVPTNIPAVDAVNQPVVSFTGPLSTPSDDVVGNLIFQLRSHFRHAGISMLDGMLRRLGYRLPRERIRESLMHIDPVQRVFQRIRIRHRVYSVPGPNLLWHNDGQHGIIFLSFHPHGSKLFPWLRSRSYMLGHSYIRFH